MTYHTAISGSDGKGLVTPNAGVQIVGLSGSDRSCFSTVNQEAAEKTEVPRRVLTFEDRFSNERSAGMVQWWAGTRSLLQKWMPLSGSDTSKPLAYFPLIRLGPGTDAGGSLPTLCQTIIIVVVYSQCCQRAGLFFILFSSY